MDLDELIRTCRLTLDDTVEPYLWSSAELETYINAAQAEAATRAHLITDEDSQIYCEIPVVIGTSGYSLHPQVLVVKSAYLDNVLLNRTTLEELNELSPTWKSDTDLKPSFYISGQTIRLVPKPTASGTLSLVVARLPVPIVSSPEIHERYHLKMLDWVYRLALLKRDADAVEVSADRPSGVASASFEAKFDKSFGQASAAVVQRNETGYRQKADNHWVI